MENIYWVGDFDYETLTFTPDHREPLNADTGMYYSYNPSLIAPDGRRIMFGWVTGAYSPSSAVPFWQGLHSIPREIHLVNGVLDQRPVREIETLKTERIAVDMSVGDVQISGTGRAYELSMVLPARACTQEIRVELLTDPDEADNRRAAAQVLLSSSGSVTFCGKETVTTPRMFDSERETRVRIFVDSSVVEIYAECGGISRAMTGRFFVRENESLNAVRAVGVSVPELVLEKMEGIWEREPGMASK